MQNYNKALEPEYLEEISEKQISYVITKFATKSFEKLTLEELAVTLITPDFQSRFKRQTGSNFDARLQVKIIDRLTNAKFDVNFLTRKTSDTYTPLFVSAIRGDINKVTEFLRKSDENAKVAIDQTGKTAFHIAAREGHISLVELLLTKGFAINARDRTLKTPLHLACLYGHEVVADVLVKNKADILAKDAGGKTVLHYACCSNSSRLLTLLIGTKPELVNLVDNIGRTALHYAIYNSSQRQVDIIRTLIENKADLNPQDDDGKTPLHHAAEAGKSRAIPILLQRGADITIKDGVNRKTALELAADERIRELIIVYSAAPLKTKPEDLEWMDQAIKGEKPPLLNATKTKKDTKEYKPPILGPPQDSKDRMFIAPFLRDKLMELMRKVQEYGIQSNQFIKRPYLFTGSWLEGVNTIQDLYDKISMIKPLETAIRIFNVLYPSDKAYPELKGEEPILSNFFGDIWNFDEGVDKSEGTRESQVIVRVQKEERDREENKKYTALVQMHQQKAEENELLVKNLQTENDRLKNEIQELKRSYEGKIKQYEKQTQIDSNEKAKLTSDLRQAIRTVSECKMKIDMLQTQVDQNQQGGQELEDAHAQIQELETKLTQEIEKNKALRYKAGQLFIKTLESNSKKAVEKFSSDPEHNFKDDEAIVKLIEALKANPVPTLNERLKKLDRDNDGKLNKAEFNQAFAKLGLSPFEINALLRVCGFYSGKDLVGIADFIKILQERPEKREKMELQLFRKLVAAFKAKNLGYEQAFAFLDANGDGMVNSTELLKGFEALGLTVTKADSFAVFHILDTDKNGTISLDELKEKMLEIENMPAPTDQNVDLGGGAGGDFEIIDLKGTLSLKTTKGIGLGIKIIPTPDVNPLVGELKIQIPGVKGLNYQGTQLAVVILLPGTAKSKLKLPVTGKYDKNGLLLKLAVKIPINFILVENISDYITVQFFKDMENENQASFLGETSFEWKLCIDNPEKWTSCEVPLENRTFSGSADVVVTGSAQITSKWITSTSASFKSSSYPKREIQPTFQSPIQGEGYLEIAPYAAINVPSQYNAFFCDLSLPDKANQEVKTFKAIVKDGPPYWIDEPLYLFFNLQQGQNLMNIECTLQGQSGDKINVIGKSIVDWQDCLRFPMEYNAYKAYLMPNSNNFEANCPKMYVKTRWIPKSEFASLKKATKVPAAATKNTKKDSKAQKVGDAVEELEEGTLKIFVMRARGFAKTADPYCVATFAAKTPYESTQSTFHIDNTSAPNWQKDLFIPVKWGKGKPVPMVTFKVMDDSPLTDGVLGTVDVDWTLCFLVPTQWKINQYFNLTWAHDDKNKIVTRELYVIISWIPKELKDPNMLPIDLDTNLEVGKQDQNMIKGKLYLYIVHAKKLWPTNKNTSHPFVQITYPDKTILKTETKKETLNPIWKEMIPREISISKNQMAPILIEVKDSNLGGHENIGFIYLDWEECYNNPGLWAVNDIKPLKGNDEIKKKLHIETWGEIYIQARFLPFGTVDDEHCAELIEDLEKELMINGKLYINIVYAAHLSAGDQSSDTYCHVILPNGIAYETKVIDNTQFPAWNDKKEFEISYEKSLLEKHILFEIFHSMLNFGFKKMSKKLGFLSLDWTPCYQNPGVWAYNSLKDLDGSDEMKRDKNLSHFGQIYIQMKYVPADMNCPLNTPTPEPTVNILEEKFKEEQSKIINGELRARVVYCKSLCKGDDSGTSDPFCVVEVAGNSNKTTKQEKKLNASWENEIVKVKVTKLPMSKYTPIKIEVFDYDSLSKNDLLGFKQIEWMDCINNPGYSLEIDKWMIDEIYELDGPPNSDIVPEIPNYWGEIYVQIKFTSNINSTDNPLPPLKSKLEDILKEEQKILKGLLYFNISHCKKLKKIDLIDIPDPYIQITLPGKKKLKIYETKDDTLNPIWTKPLVPSPIPLEIQKNQLDIPIKFEVMDEDVVSSSLLGKVYVPLNQCVTNSGHWDVDGSFPLQPKTEKIADIYTGKKDNGLGEIYLQLKWVGEGETDFEPQIPPPKEDLTKLALEEQRLITGKFCIRVLQAKDLYVKPGKNISPFVKAKYNDKEILETLSLSRTTYPIWDDGTDQKVFIVPFSIKNRDLPYDFLQFIVYDEGLIKSFSDKIGHVNIPVGPCLSQENHDKWVYDKYFALEGDDPSKSLNGFGQLYLQIKFTTAADPKVNLNLPKPSEDLKEVIAQVSKKLEGSLVIKIIGGRNLIVPPSIQNGGKTNPMPVIKIPGMNKITGPTKTNTINPDWMMRNVVDISSRLANSEKIITVDIWDDEFKDVYMGYAQIDFIKCIEQPNTWAINTIFPVLANKELSQLYPPGKLGEIYAQIKYLTKGTNDDINSDPQIRADWRTARQTLNKKYNGKIKYRVIGATNLISFEKSTGALCKILIPLQAEVRTKVDKHPNPVWNHQDCVDISLDKDERHTIIFRVCDDQDQILGVYQINFETLVEGEWIDFSYPLMTPANLPKSMKFSSFGQLTIQLVLIGEASQGAFNYPLNALVDAGAAPGTSGGIKDKNVIVPVQGLALSLVKPPSAGVSFTNANINGFIQILVACAKDITNKTETDMTCLIEFPNSEVFKSPKIKSSSNPVFNIDKTIQIKNLAPDKIQPFLVKVVSDSVLGSVEILKETWLNSSSQWIKTDFVTCTQGTGSIHVRLQFYSNTGSKNSKIPDLSPEAQGIIDLETTLLNGNLIWAAIGAKDLMTNVKSLETKIEIMFNNKSYGECSWIKGNKPYWNGAGKGIPGIPIKFIKFPISVILWHNPGFMSKRKMISKIDFAFEEIYQKKESWVHKVLKVIPNDEFKQNGVNNYGEMYLQFKYTENQKVDSNDRDKLLPEWVDLPGVKK